MHCKAIEDMIRETKEKTRREAHREAREAMIKEARENLTEMDVLDMLKNGVALENITKYTKFSIPEIHEIAKRHGL